MLQVIQNITSASHPRDKEASWINITAFDYVWYNYKEYITETQTVFYCASADI